MLIIIANVQIYPHLPTRQRIESPFCPRAKVINISVFPSAGTFPVAPLPSPLLKNTSDLPPPSQPPRVSRFQVQEPLSWQWRPSPRFQRYVPFLHPQHLLFIFLRSHFRLYFQNLRGNMIIPLENQPSMICLGPWVIQTPPVSSIWRPIEYPLNPPI